MDFSRYYRPPWFPSSFFSFAHPFWCCANMRRVFLAVLKKKSIYSYWETLAHLDATEECPSKRSVIELSNTHTARLWQQHGTKASRGFRVTLERSGGDSLLVTMSYDSLVMMISFDRTPAWDTERQHADTGVIMLWITALCVCLQMVLLTVS